MQRMLSHIRRARSVTAIGAAFRCSRYSARVHNFQAGQMGDFEAKQVLRKAVKSELRKLSGEQMQLERMSPPLSTPNMSAQNTDTDSLRTDKSQRPHRQKTTSRMHAEW